MRRELLVSVSVLSLAACGPQASSPGFGVDTNEPIAVQPPRERPSACDVTPALCSVVCGEPLFVAIPTVTEWAAPRAALLGRYGQGVQAGITWWRHESGALREYTLDGAETATIPTGVVDGDIVRADSALLLNTVTGVRVYGTDGGEPELRRIWVGARAEVVQGDAVLLSLGTMTALVSINPDGSPVERACFDRTLGAGFSTWASGRSGNVWMGAGVEVVDGALVPGAEPRIVLVALDPGRFGTVIAEFPIEKEAPASFVSESVVEVSDRGRVRWFVLGATTVQEIEVPAVRQDLGAARAVAPHYIVREDGRGLDVSDFSAPVVIGMSPIPDGDTLPCRIDITDAGGSPIRYMHPAHFPGVLFEPDGVERVDCEPLVPFYGASVEAGASERVAVESGPGGLLVDADGGAKAIPEAATPPWIWTREHLVSVDNTGGDFGMPVVARMMFVSLDSLAFRTLDVPGRVLIARSDDANVWFVAEGRGYNYGDPAPEPREWRVRRVRADDATGDVFEFVLPRGFEPVDAVPDQLGGAWVFGRDQSVLHYDREGAIISQSDIPPGTSALTMTKAANANGLVVGDGKDAWWYDPTGIRRPIPDVAVYDVVGASPDSYCLLMAAVDELPEGAAGPYQVARVVIERVADALTVTPVAAPMAADGLQSAGCGDGAAVAGRSIVWTATATR